MAKVTKFAIRPEPLTVVHEAAGYELHRADGSLHSTHASERESTAAVIRLSNQLREESDDYFTCLHCDTRQLNIDAVDVSAFVAIARGAWACTTCALELEEAEGEVATVPDLSGTIERARAELRACGALVGGEGWEDLGW